MRLLCLMIGLVPLFAAQANDAGESQAPSDDSSVLCVHSRVRQAGQQTGHAWISFYDAAEDKATEFHFGRYDGEDFKVRDVTVQSWRALTYRRDEVVRGRCVSIAPNQVDALWEKAHEIAERDQPYNLTSNNCVTTALSIWNATVLPSQKLFRVITPAALYRKL